MTGSSSRAEEDALNRDFYRSLLREHGISARSLNWSGPAAQRDRFAALFEAGISADASVLDVGCGLADLRGYLLERGHRGQYQGVDLIPEMIATAQGRFPDTRFEVVDFMKESEVGLKMFASDVVVASGIFYLRRIEAGAYMRGMIERLFGIAGQMLVFNSLSSWADRPAGEGEFRADPAETLRFCRGLTPWCILRHDYHPGDFTIAMRRTRRTADS